MSDRASVVLPQPDSPARARISPSEIVRSTPSTARARTALWLRRLTNRPARPANSDVEPAHLQQSDRSAWRPHRDSHASVPRAPAVRPAGGTRRVVPRPRIEQRGILARDSRSNASRAPRVEAAAARHVARIGWIAVQPGRGLDVPLVARSAGTRRRGHVVYGCFGSRKTSVAGPSSTIRPRTSRRADRTPQPAPTDRA